MPIFQIYYIKMDDNLLEEKVLFKSYMGSSSPESITVPGDHVMVTYKSETNLIGNGFRLEWVVNGEIYSHIFYNSIFIFCSSRLWRASEQTWKPRVSELSEKISRRYRLWMAVGSTSWQEYCPQIYCSWCWETEYVSLRCHKSEIWILNIPKNNEQKVFILFEDIELYQISASELHIIYSIISKGMKCLLLIFLLLNDKE